MSNYKTEEAIRIIKLFFLESEIYPQKILKKQQIEKEIKLKENKLITIQKIITRKNSKKIINHEELNDLYSEKKLIQKEIAELEEEVINFHILTPEKYKIFTKILNSLSEIDKNIIHDYYFRRIQITNLTKKYNSNYRYIDKVIKTFTDDVLNIV